MTQQTTWSRGEEAVGGATHYHHSLSIFSFHLVVPLFFNFGLTLLGSISLWWRFSNFLEAPPNLSIINWPLSLSMTHCIPFDLLLIPPLLEKGPLKFMYDIEYLCSSLPCWYIFTNYFFSFWLSFLPTPFRHFLFIQHSIHSFATH